MTVTNADRLRRAVARFEKSEDVVRGIPRMDFLDALHLALMAGEYLDQIVARIEDMAAKADDETEVLIVALDVTLAIRGLLRAVREAIERLEEGIGNVWSPVLPGRRRA